MVRDDGGIGMILANTVASREELVEKISWMQKPNTIFAE